MAGKAKRWLALLVLVSAACIPQEQTPTAAPTLTLIAATVTDTPTPVTPTPTAQTDTLSRPDEVTNATPTENAQPSIPAFAAPLVSAALDDLSEALAIERDEIQLVRLEATRWFGDDLSCENSSAAPQADETGIEGFWLVFAADGQRYEYHTDNDGTILRCDSGGAAAEGTEADTLLTVDPIAAELVELARRRLADALDLPIRRIRLSDVAPVRWQDSSLGCPQPEQRYSRVEIDGYRIVMAVGDDLHIFHSDSERLTLCPIELEVLPAGFEVTPEATAEVTAEATDET